MVGAVKFIQLIVIYFEDEVFAVNIKLLEVMFAIGIVTLRPVAENCLRPVDLDDLIMAE